MTDHTDQAEVLVSPERALQELRAQFVDVQDCWGEDELERVLWARVRAGMGRR